MFHSRGVNNRFNKIHERTLWLVYKDDKSTFEELLMKDKSFTIHDRNLQVLATEIYKVINNISPAITNSIFQIKKTPHNLRGGINLCTNNVKTVKYGTETLSFRGSKSWAEVPDYIKKIPILYWNLNQKLKNGNLLDASVNFAAHIYIIWDM